MIKTNKLLRLKTKNGRLLDVVREHYLRKDVPCHSEICPGCEQLGRESNESLYHDYVSQSEGSVGENLQIICRLRSFLILLFFKKMHPLFVAFNESTSFGQKNASVNV